MLLINAVKDGRTAQVKMFIKVGIDLNEVDENGQTGIIHSCFLHDARVRMCIFKALVIAGADINKTDNFGRSVLSWACLKGRVNMVRFLLNDPMCIDLQVNVTDKDGNSTLLLSVICGNFLLVKMIVEALKDTARASELNKANNVGMQPLIAAFLRGDKFCAQLLVQQVGSSVPSILKYLKSVQNDSNELCASSSSLPLFDSSQNKRQTLERFAQLTEDNILEFLFTKDEGSTDKQKCESQEIKDNDKSSPQQKIKLARRSMCNKQEFILRQRSETKESTSEISTYSNSLKGSHYPVMSNKLLSVSTHENLASARGNNKSSSSRTSVQKLFILYAEQNSPSFRHGLPVCKYAPATEQPRLNPEGDGELDSRGTSLHPGEYDSIAELSPRLLGESPLDQQMRVKHARNSRATSMQVPRLPSLGRGRVKRTRSSTIMRAVKL